MNTAIPLGVRPIQLDDPMTLLARLEQFQGAVQDRRIRALQEQRLIKDVADEQAVRAALSRSVDPKTGRPDLARAASDIARIDGAKALDIWSKLDDLQRKQLANERDMAGWVAQRAGALLDLGDDQIIGSYVQAREELLRQPGVKGDAVPDLASFVSKAPRVTGLNEAGVPGEMADSKAVVKELRGYLKTKQREALTAKEQIDAAEKAADQELRRRTDERRAEHQRLTREQTARRDAASAATAARNAASNERRAAAAERRAAQGPASERDDPELPRGVQTYLYDLSRKYKTQAEAEAELERAKASLLKDHPRLSMAKAAKELGALFMPDKDKPRETAGQALSRRMMEEAGATTSTPTVPAQTPPATKPSAPAPPPPTVAGDSALRAEAQALLQQFTTEQDPAKKAVLGARLRQIRAQLVGTP